MCYLNRSYWLCTLFLLGSIFWIDFGDCRSRRQQVCDEDQQNKMNTEFQECLSKFTKEHHEASGKATKAEEFQVRNYSIREIYSHKNIS